MEDITLRDLRNLGPTEKEQEAPFSTFDEAVKFIAAQAARLVVSKQHDYGPNNILMCPVGPELGIVVRTYDKLSRLANLIQAGKTPDNEALTDTADDIIGYGLVLKMVQLGYFTLPLEKK